MTEIAQVMAAGVPWLAATNIAQGQAGSGSGFVQDMGNINVQFAAAPGSGANPASTGSDIVMAVYTLPGLSFDVAGRAVNIELYGQTVNNANTKTFKIIVAPTTATVGSAVSGGTTLASGSVTTVAGGVFLAAQITKYGAAGSNTQLATHFAGQFGATATALVAPQALTLTENAGIIIAVTINAATTATDATFWQLIVNFMN